MPFILYWSVDNLYVCVIVRGRATDPEAVHKLLIKKPYMHGLHVNF